MKNEERLRNCHRQEGMKEPWDVHSMLFLSCLLEEKKIGWKKLQNPGKIWSLNSSNANVDVQVWQRSLVAQPVKRLPAMREAWVRSLGWEDTLEKGRAIHSSVLTWRNTESRTRLTVSLSHVVKRVPGGETGSGNGYMGIVSNTSVNCFENFRVL